MSGETSPDTRGLPYLMMEERKEKKHFFVVVRFFVESEE